MPINIRVAEWNPDAPPSGWEADIRRWVILDTVRNSATNLTFAAVLSANTPIQRRVRSPA